MKTLIFSIILIILTVFSSIAFADDLPDTVFPWGAYSTHRDLAERDTLRDILGFNVIYLNIHADDDSNRICEKIEENHDDGMKVFPGRYLSDSSGYSNNILKYCDARYVQIEAEDIESEVRFTYHDGHQEGDYWVHQGDSNDDHIVYGLAFHQENSIYYKSAWRIMIEIDTANVPEPEDTIADYKVIIADAEPDPDTNIYLVYPITAGMFSDGQGGYVDTAIVIYFDPYRRDIIAGDPYGKTNFKIKSRDSTITFYLDWFKVRDDRGERLIENHEFDDNILAMAGSAWAESYVAGWYLRDEPVYEHYRAYRHYDSLFQYTSQTQRAVTIFLTSDTVGSPQQMIKDFLKISQPEVVWLDKYGFHGGQYVVGGTNKTYYTEYTGGKYRDTSGYIEHRGQQFAHYFNAEVESLVNAACIEDDNCEEWWIVPQAFGYMYLDDSETNWSEDEWWWRPVTKSELSCNTFIGLCNNAKGVLYWKYHPWYRDTVLYSVGLLDTGTVDNKTDMWHAVEDMAPYINATGKLLRELEWQGTYYCSSSSQTFSNKIVKSVRGYSDTTNPDLGWFHMGDFTKNGDKYFMLVNRACNIDSVTLAPDVTAIVEINRSFFNNAERLLVIDIADSITTDWAAVSETTYTSLYDDKLYFTTVLKAGEGRLFKIAEADNMDLGNNDNVLYFNKKK